MKTIAVCSFILILIIALFLNTACTKDQEPESGMFKNTFRLKKEYDIKPLEKIDAKLLSYFDVPAEYSKSFMPVKDMKFLGHSSAKVYLGENLPDHHHENAKLLAREGIDYNSDLGQVYVFDFTAITPEGQSMPIRVAFNTGEGDCNDGYWGEVWNKDTEEVVVDIMSTGDYFTTITARTKQPDIFDSAKIPILDKIELGFHPVYVGPGDSKEDNVDCYYTHPVGMECTKDRNLARIVALALNIFNVRLHDAYPKRYVRELEHRGP